MAKAVSLGRGKELGSLCNSPHPAFYSLGNFLFCGDRGSGVSQNTHIFEIASQE